MATKLKNLRVKRVALVDSGANPDAYIRFIKNQEGEPGTPEESQEQGLLSKIMAAIAKAFGADTVAKAAHTFAQAEEARDYERIMEEQFYPMHWAFRDSMYSILTDIALSDESKAAMLKQSASEYTQALLEAMPAWALAKPAAGIEVKDSVATLKAVSKHINSLIEKASAPGSSEANPDAEEPGTGDTAADNDTNSGQEPAVEKGETADMKFDTSKMTEQERATYDDLAKRYGSEQETQKPEEPDKQPEQEGDIYKGLHPAVKAELDGLRKKAEEMEDKEILDVAKKYTLLGKKPEELAPVLKNLKAAGGTAYNDMLTILDSNVELMEKSGVFGEIGKRGTVSESDAWKKIEAAASEIAKAKTTLSWAEAIDEACAKHPDLVADYEKSRN